MRVAHVLIFCLFIRVTRRRIELTNFARTERDWSLQALGTLFHVQINANPLISRVNSRFQFLLYFSCTHPRQTENQSLVRELKSLKFQIFG